MVKRRRNRVRAVRYQPEHQSQRNHNDPNGDVNCTAYAAAMLADAATHGGVTITGKYVRANSSEPIPDKESPGLNLPQVIKVLRQLHIEVEDNTGEGFDALRAAIDGDKYAIVQGDYGDLPNASTCNPAFNGPHAILVSGRRKSDNTYSVFDPECRERTRLKGPELKKYAEGLNPKVFFATSRVTPRIAVKVN